MKKAILLASFLMFSCATTSGQTYTVLKRAVFDLNCPEEALDITQLSSSQANYGTTYGVRGCGKQVTYIVRGDGFYGYTAVMNSPQLDESLLDKKPGFNHHHHQAPHHHPGH